MNICIRRQKYFSRVSGTLLGINILMIGEGHMDSGIIPQNSVAVAVASAFWFELCVEKQSKAIAVPTAVCLHVHHHCSAISNPAQKAHVIGTAG